MSEKPESPMFVTKRSGFREELGHLREIGMRITTLEEMISARPHREPEMVMLNHLKVCLERLRVEISKTRDV